MPPKPPAGNSPSKGSVVSWLAILLLVGSLVLSVGLLWLGQVGKFAPFLVVLAGLFFAAVGFHYVVWGWWLPRILARDAEREMRERSDIEDGGP